MLPEEQSEQQPVRFTVASQETNLEALPPVTAPPIPPTPKPRTFQPGKGVERPSSGKAEPGEAPPVTSAVELPPPEAPEAPSLAPKVPPRRKKSAPAAFHLQVLQSNSHLLQGLTRSSSSPSPLKPDAHPLCPQVALGTLSATSPETDGPRVMEPEAASFHGDYPDPFWSLLHHPKLLNNSWLSKSSEPLDLGSRNPERTHTEPAQVIASVAERGLPPDHGGKDFSHWMAASNKDKRTTLGV